MDPIECIRSRRSVRKFKSMKIPEIVLYRTLEAACWAPSAGNTQNWRFIIVEDDVKKKAIARSAHGQDWILSAPVLIVVCSETGVVSSAYEHRGKELYAIQNVAASIQNVLLAANSFGLASCWIGAFVEPLIRKECNIPDFIDIHAIIALGYPASMPRSPSKIDVADVLYFEKWGNIGRGKSPFPLSEHVSTAKSALKETIDRVTHHIKKIRGKSKK